MRGFLCGTRVENRHDAAQKPSGFAGSPHGARSRKSSMTPSETSHPARQFFRQELPLAQFAGDRAELFPALSPATQLRDSVYHWWLTNQLSISWSLLVLPLALELTF